MSEGSSNKVWMIIALAAIAALVVSIVTRPDAPATDSLTAAQTDSAARQPGKATESATKAIAPKTPAAVPGKSAPPPLEAPPVDDDMGMAVPAAAGATAVVVPDAPTPTNMPSHVQKDRGESGAPFPFKGKEDVVKYLGKRIDEVGEEKLSRYLSATYTGMTTETSAPTATTISVAAGKSAVVQYVEANARFQVGSGKCVEDNDGAVLQCRLFDAARTWLYRGAHDATLLLPLQKPPYTLVKAEEIFAKDDANERTSKRYIYKIAGTDLSLVVLQDPDDLKPLGVHIRSKSLEQAGVDSVRCRMTGWEEMDGVMFARRWHVSWRAGDNVSGEVKRNAKAYNVVITSIVAGAAGAQRPLPALTPVKGPIRVAPRRALTVTTEPAQPTKMFAVWRKMYTALPPNRVTLHHGMYEVVDADGKITAWVDPLAASRAMAAPNFQAVAAQPAVARRLYRIPVDAGIDAINAFAGELQRNGYNVVAGPRAARLLRWPKLPDKPGQAVVGDSLLEIQVPVQPK